MIPKEFTEKMKKILGEEIHSFTDALENGGAVRGLRVNLIKTEVKDVLDSGEFRLDPISYADNGFILREERQVGASPYHHAGMIYMQDPGAMASACSIDIQSDWWVADLCSAPGGKSSQVAEQLGESGFLLSNEYVPKRAKIIVGNFERLGVKNAMVTSLDTAEIARMFSAVFDLVIADAPCSGEGMFRKSEEARDEWSEENVLLCAKRQSEILDNASGLVKPGGYLLYSTCTYSPEENEEQIARFVKEHPEYRVIPVSEAVKKCTRPGLSLFGDCEGIEHTRRFYPHVTDGEGQYVALLKRSENIEVKQTILYKDEAKPLSKQEKAAVDDFFKENLAEIPKGRTVKVGENIVLISHDCPIPKRSVFMSGTLIGEIRGNTLIPSHQFFSVYGKIFKRTENLTPGDDRVEKYLRGEEIDASTDIKGWCAVTFLGATLGGGKASGGKIKNHYPKGLRTR